MTTKTLALGKTSKPTAVKKEGGKANSKEPVVKETAKKATPLDSADELSESSVEGMIDQDEIEEQEEAAASSSSQNGNAAALAAATGSSSEMSASFKNFRHHPDMENFYRFIFENDLRHEALAIIDEIMAEKAHKKMVKGAKSQPH